MVSKSEVNRYYRVNYRGCIYQRLLTIHTDRQLIALFIIILFLHTLLPSTSPRTAYAINFLSVFSLRCLFRSSSDFYLAHSTPTALWFGVFPRAVATLESGGAPATVGQGQGQSQKLPSSSWSRKQKQKTLLGAKAFCTVLSQFIWTALWQSRAADYISKCVFCRI